MFQQPRRKSFKRYRRATLGFWRISINLLNKRHFIACTRTQSEFFGQIQENERCF